MRWWRLREKEEILKPRGLPNFSYLTWEGKVESAISLAESSLARWGPFSFPSTSHPLQTGSSVLGRLQGLSSTTQENLQRT